MMRQQLLRKTQQLLATHGYAVQGLHASSFDILAQKGSQLLAVKVLADANALTAAHAAELRAFAAALTAAPLVIAERAGGILDPDVVAVRHGLFTVTHVTFAHALAAQPLLFLRSSAGITAQIDGAHLRSARQSLGLSLADVAERIGVSRTMAAQYEGGAHIIAQRAVRLADLLDRQVLAPVSLFSPSSGALPAPTTPIGQKYLTLGFSAIEMHRLPFDIVARRQGEIILTEVGDRYRQSLSPLSALLQADSLVIFDRHKPKDVPALQREEFLDMEGPQELIRFVKTY